MKNIINQKLCELRELFSYRKEIAFSLEDLLTATALAVWFSAMFAGGIIGLFKAVAGIIILSGVAFASWVLYHVVKG